MKVIVERDRIRTVYIRWKRTYDTGEYGKDKLTIMNQLGKLNLDTVSSEEIKKIIGNRSWTDLICDEREKSVKR